MMKTKRCTTCNKIKNALDFSKNKLYKSGIKNECRECHSAYRTEYFRTKKGLVDRIYSTQKSTSKRRGDVPPTYSRGELRGWLYSQEKFHLLYDNWKRLDYQSEYKPSIDRKNDYIGYTMSNIQLMTWGENNKKGISDTKNGINNKKSRSVLQFGLDGKLIAEHHSIRSAERKTGVSQRSIGAVCDGKRKSSVGFIWRYNIGAGV